LKFYMGNAYEDEDYLRGWKNSKVGRSPTVLQGSVVLYTTDTDFKMVLR
jgi:hypothetical protein